MKVTYVIKDKDNKEKVKVCDISLFGDEYCLVIGPFTYVAIILKFPYGPFFRDLICSYPHLCENLYDISMHPFHYGRLS